MLARISLISVAIFANDKVIAGKIKCFKPFNVNKLLFIPKKMPNWPLPEGGNHPKNIEKTKISIMPNQKEGKDIPTMENVIIVLLLFRLGYAPA
jgi:hypothetical protein